MFDLLGLWKNSDEFKRFLYNYAVSGHSIGVFFIKDHQEITPEYTYEYFVSNFFSSHFYGFKDGGLMMIYQEVRNKPMIDDKLLESATKKMSKEIRSQFSTFLEKRFFVSDIN